MDSHYH